MADQSVLTLSIENNQLVVALVDEGTYPYYQQTVEKQASISLFELAAALKPYLDGRE